MRESFDRNTAAYERMYKTFVSHPHFQNAMTEVRDALSLHGCGGDMPCLQVTGPTGVGKTTLRKKLAADYATETDGRKIPVPGCPQLIVDHVPLLQFEMPENPSVATLCKAALEVYGDPLWHKGERDNLKMRFELAVKQAGTIGILIDEAQRLVDRSGVIVKDEIADWLKAIHARTGCVLILLGLGRFRFLFEKDAQIARRWDAEIRLEPYRWRDDKGNDLLDEQAIFIAILDALQRSSPIAFSPEMRVKLEDGSDNEIGILRFFFASQGVIGLVKKLFLMCVRQVKRGKREHSEINRETLWAAFDGSFRSRTKHVQNPFSNEWQAYDESGPGLSHMDFADLGKQAGEKGIIPPGALELAFHGAF